MKIRPRPKKAATPPPPPPIPRLKVDQDKALAAFMAGKKPSER